MAESQIWLLVAFTAPPANARMFPAKSGKCWWRRLDSREAAFSVAHILKVAGVSYKCTKADADGPMPKRAPLRKSLKGSRGTAAREQKQQKFDRDQAIKIFEAGIIEGRKQARLAREKDKRAAEANRQRERRSQTAQRLIDADQAARAEVIAKVYGRRQ